METSMKFSSNDSKGNVDASSYRSLIDCSLYLRNTRIDTIGCGKENFKIFEVDKMTMVYYTLMLTI